ncbi:MAG: twin-arginine translocase subunit TatC [Actinomycetota bacterium]
MADNRMKFLEHIAELRKRLMVSALAVAVGFSGSLFFSVPLLRVLIKPAGNLHLVFLSPMEPFLVKVKVAFFAGMALALPVILYEILAFAAPGMKKKEKRLIFPIIVSMIILFVGGVAFGYRFIMPISTAWLLAQAGEIMKASVSASSYVTYAGWFLLGFGISFETPLFVLLMVRLGVISPQKLRSSWRYALLIILLISAVITPDWSPITMAVMAGPMLIFYILSCFLAGLVAPKPQTETA